LALAMTLRLKVLVSFNGANGTIPAGPLIADANGDLFGVTAFGGATGNGTVFEITNTVTGYASTPDTLVSFDGTNGYAPNGGLIADTNGNLFGTTEGGGENGLGILFEIANTATGYASTPTVLAGFNDAIDTHPSAPIADANGNLFGTTLGGGSTAQGTVYEIAKTATGYASIPTTLVSFNGANGDTPEGSLLTDTNGDLFGTTVIGGAEGYGTVFEIANTPTGYASTPTTLVSFDAANGRYPIGRLVADAKGDLFGTTSGRIIDQGTVFEIAKTATGYASTPTTLVTFSSEYEEGGLIIDAKGDLFGTSRYEGMAFEIANTATGYATTPTTLVSFDGANGAGPIGNLLADAHGDLFGATENGGSTDNGTVFEITDSGFVVCFARGTQIATPAGEMPVEQLSVGDTVLPAKGQAQPIVWIGVGRVLVTPGRRSAATPVIVRRNALADNVPHRDLHVTKGHSLFIDDVLIPVEFLVNHRSIIWDDQAREVDIYHVELAKHGVLIADGALAESYRDDGNRWLFQNGNSGWGLPPQLPCAPVLTGEPIVDAIWRRLLDRAGPRPGLPTTADADLHLLVDGRRVDGKTLHGGVHLFHLSRRPASVSIVSRAAAPQELGRARDPRCLGVAVRRIVLRQDSKFRVTKAADASLVDGFHQFEAENGHRWTDGDAVVPTELFAGYTGAMEIMLEVAGSTHYLDTGDRQQVA
jgi:uncharacterized repeat protein (TIGR03803 family)